VGLEWGPLSLASTTEELLERKSSGSGLKNRYYGLGDLPRSLCGIPYPQKLALSLLTRGGRPVSIVHSRTKAIELFKVSLSLTYLLTTGKLKQSTSFVIKLTMDTNMLPSTSMLCINECMHEYHIFFLVFCASVLVKYFVRVF
jgi:hypothetical protein